MNTTIAKEKIILLSKKGMKEIKKEISQLEHDRSNIIRSLREIDRNTGHDDRLQRVEKLAQLEAVESNLVEKRQTLNEAQLIPSKRARMKVAMGSVVDLIDQQGRLFRYTLVDSIEANPSDGRISVVSPLGSHLVGKTVQDIVEWSTGKSDNTLRLVRIN
jgi:transcription elongation factor GreA